ncbi:hypothetical protein [Fundidesulfovibrio agrisoli]|uniref:hypothetical protein n=1 Tax=Fundidesulfovibrio agrisoli TaxID=2922717 RepID=UPI001FAD9124|nr:hypothetical protein [Fundidesulfovibrio agrisoli]
MNDNLKPLVREAIKEALEDGALRQDCCAGCDLAPGEHARHHQMLRGAFSLRTQLFNAVVTSLVGGGLAWLGLAAWERLVRQAVK